MFLESFEIENFRKIKHVKCILSPKITVLAGRNEAGKTSILQALEALNEGWEFKETDRPENIQGEKFLLTANFTISEEEKKQWLSKCSIDAVSNSKNVKIIKSNEEPTYIVIGEWVNDIRHQIEDTKEEIKKLKQMSQDLNDILKENSVSQRISEIENIDDSSEKIQQIRSQINPIIPWMTQNKPAVLPKIKPTIDAIFEKIEEIVDISEKEEEFLDAVDDFIPHIVYFNSFDDILPSEIPLPEFIDENTLKTNNRGVNDLIRLSGLNREHYAQADKMERANMANKASKVTSEVFLMNIGIKILSNYHLDLKENQCYFLFKIKEVRRYSDQINEVKDCNGICRFSYD